MVVTTQHWYSKKFNKFRNNYKKRSKIFRALFSKKKRVQRGYFCLFFVGKSGAKVFNARCKNTVFKHPNGSSKLHPTEKNHGLLKELILDNTNEGDVVFDPCCGSGSHLFVAQQNNRKYYGIEIDKDYYEITLQRLGVL